MNKGFCTIETSRLVKAPWNYKEDNAELAAKLENNIRRNGQIENIIVRELDGGMFEVVNGNHRLDAMLKLGFDEVFCYNLGNISDVVAKKIAIETNETKFKSNTYELELLLVDLAENISIDSLVQTLPFDEEYFQWIVEKQNFDVDSFLSENKDESKEHKQKELICPHCGKNVYSEDEQ